MKATEEFLKTAGFSKVNGRAADGADRWIFDGPPYFIVPFYTDNNDKNISISDLIEGLTEKALEYYQPVI